MEKSLSEEVSDGIKAQVLSEELKLSDKEGLKRLDKLKKQAHQLNKDTVELFFGSDFTDNPNMSKGKWRNEIDAILESAHNIVDTFNVIRDDGTNKKLKKLI